MTAQTPSVARIALSRTVIELKEFSREREAVVFILAFPVLLLVLFSSVFGSGNDFITLPSGHGISAVPTYVFDDKYIVEGAQPTELFLQALNTIAEEEAAADVGR